jgi:microcompartment protein CcmK/EutM
MGQMQAQHLVAAAVLGAGHGQAVAKSSAWRACTAQAVSSVAASVFQGVQVW